MKQSLRFGTFSGIPVGVHWGLLAVAGVYWFSLATSILPDASPGGSAVAYWGAGAISVVLLFASVLAHEAGHALVAQREGIGVKAITLWLLGGVAELEDEAQTAGAEFRIAAAGPAVSLFLTLGFAGSWYAANTFDLGLFATVLGWLAVVNGLLTTFNLIPAAPLDGGRILSSVLWWRNGDPYRSRGTSARVGQIFGMFLAGLGIWSVANGGSLFLPLIGWFLVGGATAERQRAELFSAATRTRVGEVMTPLTSPTDGAVTSLGLAAMAGDTSAVAFPVLGSGGTVEGIIPPATLQRAFRAKAPLRADKLMISWDQFVSARTNETLEPVLERLRVAATHHVLVYDEAGREVGYVGPAEIGRARRDANKAPADTPLVAH